MARRYRNPPVVEALAEIYFTGSAWDMTVPGSFYERIKERFPHKGQVDVVGVDIELGPEGTSARSVAETPRSQFSTADRSRMVQVGRDLLVVNQLRPYPHFEAWSPVIPEMLSEYRELAQPTGVARLGVRYINRITIPQPGILMEQYFKIYPEIPSELGDEHGPFFLRIALRPRHAGHSLLVTIGSATPEQPEQMAYLLDLYDTVPMDDPVALDIVLRRVNEAHENIEHAFENAITDATRALFDEVVP